MNNLIFYGGLFPKDEEDLILKNSIGNIQLAANNNQWRYVKGFDINLNNNVYLINKMFISSYPKHYKKCFIKKRQFSHNEVSQDINLGFINLCYLKHFISPFHEKSYIMKYIENFQNSVFFIYSLSAHTVKIANMIKKRFPKIPVLVYVGDLPSHVMKDHSHKKLVYYWKKMSINKINKYKSKIDGYVFVTKYQAEEMKISKDNYIILEGMIKEKKDFVPLNDLNTKNIIYAGALSRYYGILEFIDIFKKIKRNDINFLICGDGEIKDELIDKIKDDERIKYLGKLPETQLENVLRSATILINPTENKYEFTRFSFPLKNIDYLSAGRPVICQKLSGIPPEYDPYFYYYNDKESLIKEINLILSYTIDQINEIGKRNVEFVNSKKNNVIQTKRILDFADTISRRLQ